MRTLLEETDIDAIPQRVADILKPFLSPKKETDDTILSVKELADYLRVSVKWVYDNSYSLPKFKAKGKLCFREREIDILIDQWALEERTKQS
jgi:hypothetical protein